MNMIKFYGVSKKLLNEVLVLKNRYPDYVEIEGLYEDTVLRSITIHDGAPIILRYYGLDNQIRLEVGSYLSDLISSIDYISVEMA